MLTLPKDLIDSKEEAFNVPYVTYVKGSYFGDSDCWPHETENKKDGDDMSKFFRDSTAEADHYNRVAVVMVIKKSHFEEELRKFPQIHKFVRQVAKEKLEYHASLINIIVAKHQDP